MSQRRYRALLVGNWHYPDDPSNLPDLQGPLNDVSRLAEALADPAAGLFAPADVTALTERASHEIAAEMESFFGDASRDDVLLVYYSGHGITADDGSLLLCGRNARTDRRLATTVSSETVNRMIRGCAAAAVVIVLDCCHAGAFKSGDLAGELAGKGRFVLTASRSRDRAPDAEHATGMSRFTAHLLRGIRGEAAPPGSNHVTLTDLYQYVHRRMIADGTAIPQRRFDGDGEIVISRATATVAATARAPDPPAPAAPVSSLILSDNEIDVGEVREGETLPVERVQVSGRAPDGSPAAWVAETEADWVALQPHPTHLDLRLTPRAGHTRANVHIRNVLTGEIRTLRIFARPPAVTPAPPAVASATRVDQGDISRNPGTQPSTLPLINEQPRQAWSGAEATQTADIVARVLRGARLPGLTIGPSRRRPEKEARKFLGLSDGEATLGVMELSVGAVVLFTSRALYWRHGDMSMALSYQDFAGREIRAVGLEEKNWFLIGDAVPRWAGDRAPALVGLLTTVRDSLASSP